MTDNRLEYGLRWVGSILPGAEGMPKAVPLRVATAYAGAVNGTDIDINIGDAVHMLTDGTIEHADPGEVISHVIVGIGPYWDGTKMVYGRSLPAANAWGTVQERAPRVYGIPVFGQLFEACCDDAVTATTEAAYIALIGKNIDHALATGGQPRSNLLLDISTSSGGTATAQWRIYEISSSLENRFFDGNYVRLIVQVNEGQLQPGTFSATGV